MNIDPELMFVYFYLINVKKISKLYMNKFAYYNLTYYEENSRVQAVLIYWFDCTN